MERHTKNKAVWDTKERLRDLEESRCDLGAIPALSTYSLPSYTRAQLSFFGRWPRAAQEDGPGAHLAK